MKSTATTILIINAGSSGIKFALYQLEDELSMLLSGEITGLSTESVSLSFINSKGEQINNYSKAPFSGDHYADLIISSLHAEPGFNNLRAIGHRIVHGMHYTKPQIIRDKLLQELQQNLPFDPEHIPLEIRLIEQFEKHFPQMVQIACFDTSFHASMPPAAKRVPIPEKLSGKVIQRYGFHGISYEYLIAELKRVAGNEAAEGKVIIAHLGSGASLCAIAAGKSLDTSMGFTPASGIAMSTRSGDLDPGIASFLLQAGGVLPKELNRIFNHESGLLSVSGTTGDVRELLTMENTDLRAAEAIDLFCYQAKKCIGAYAAALHGLDTLVFSGGIGEHLPGIRRRICEGLQFIGIEINEERNNSNEAVISSDDCKVKVRVIRTNEQLMIAMSVVDVLHLKENKIYENTN